MIWNAILEMFSSLQWGQWCDLAETRPGFNDDDGDDDDEDVDDDHDGDDD